MVATAAYSSYVTEENEYYGSNVGGGVLRWKQNDVCESRGCSFLKFDEYSSSRVDAKALFIIVVVGDTNCSALFWRVLSAQQNIVSMRMLAMKVVVVVVKVKNVCLFIIVCNLQ